MTFSIMFTHMFMTFDSKAVLNRQLCREKCWQMYSESARNIKKVGFSTYNFVVPAFFVYASLCNSVTPDDSSTLQ